MDTREYRKTFLNIQRLPSRKARYTLLRYPHP